MWDNKAANRCGGEQLILRWMDDHKYGVRQ